MAVPVSALHDESVASWKTNAAYWDDGIGQHGNNYWKRLQQPALERMISFPSSGTDARVLELATGNGLVARWLASKGASVLATDIHTEMLELAARRETPEHTGSISYLQLDVTDPLALDEFAEQNATSGGFDAIVMNMAIMDVATIEPLAAALPKLLKKGGIFVATLSHPVFVTSGARRNIQIVDSGPNALSEVIRSKTIENYLDVPPYHGFALPGQPAQQLYFHRPLHELFSVFFKAGLVMDAMEEPAFTPEDAMPQRIQASVNYTQLPAILAFRMRRVA
ncbi:S-adenosyl-L-methionine-dependent methyltransferase [Nemania sp. NC0429]|nr:S-adenosyl-L-methionine-dependent methyltransferase [Nemania sp. NC0429]